MSSFSLHIATDNAAFDEHGTVNELNRIMRRLGNDLVTGQKDLEGGTLRDINGNTVGRWFWTDRAQTHDDAAVLDMLAGASFADRVGDLVALTGRDPKSFPE